MFNNPHILFYCCNKNIRPDRLCLLILKNYLTYQLIWTTTWYIQAGPCSVGSRLRPRLLHPPASRCIQWKECVKEWVVVVSRLLWHSSLKPNLLTSTPYQLDSFSRVLQIISHPRVEWSIIRNNCQLYSSYCGRCCLLLLVICLNRGRKVSRRLMSLL